MNKSIFGQVMAISIIAIPAVVFGWLIFTLRSIGDTGGGTITTVAMWVFGATLTAIVLYFTIALGWKHRSKGSKIVGGVKDLFNSSKDGNKKGLIATWWAKLDEGSSPGQQFVVMVVALLLAYTEFRITGTVWAALIFLLIAAVIKPPKSRITKGFMYFDLGIIILAAFFTGFAGMRHQSFEIMNAWASNGNEAMAHYAKSLKDKTPSVGQPALQAQIAPLKKVALTSKWSEAVYSPMAGGTVRYYCTEPGSQMKIDFDSAKSSIVSPGQTFLCPLREQRVIIGEMLVNPRYYFQSDNGGYAFIENGV